MKRFFVAAAVAGSCLVGSVQAEYVPAKIIMPGDAVWEGFVTGRDAEDANLIKFRKSPKTKAVLIGANTIELIEFQHGISDDVIEDGMKERKFEPLIEMLNKRVKPYELYNDVPSNLTAYRFQLMKLYYWTGQYGKAVEVAEAIQGLIKDEDVADENRVFRALALIQDGKQEKVLQLLEETKTKDESAETLYIQARAHQSRQEYEEALKKAARVVAVYSTDQNWMAPAELLCAELYAQSHMYESAEQVLQQFLMMYKNLPEAEAAENLLKEVEMELYGEVVTGAEK